MAVRPGMIFGLLTVERLLSGSESLNLKQRAVCLCACGNTNIEVRTDALVSGRTSSCGCRFGHNGRKKIMDHPFASLRPEKPSKRIPKNTYVFMGRELTLKEISLATGISIQALWNRLAYQGWDPETAFTTSPSVKTYRKRVVQDPELGSDVRWRRKNRKKVLAQKTVQTAILSGRLQRKPCEVCGDSDSHGHHDDYDKFLDVRWLCVVHHNKWHRLHGEGANADTPFPSRNERMRMNSLAKKINKEDH